MTRPSFTADQIVGSTDIQRNWKKLSDDRLANVPFLVVMSGTDPKAVVMSYDRFEKFWQELNSVHELCLEAEALYRLAHAKADNSMRYTLKELMAMNGITWDELEGMPDAELDSE